jgi:hypothetical protein
MLIAEEPQAAGRGWRRWFVAALVPMMLSTGCQTATGTGAALGGLGGAGIGALAGGKKGALAGGLIGAAAGGVTGAVVDNNNEKKAERAAVADATYRAPTKEDVVRMTQSNVPDSEIINQIRSSRAVYRLSPDDVIYLNQNGVHQPVISEMQGTSYPPVPVRRVYAEPPPRQVIVVEEAPPPPPSFGVGVTYRR